MQEGTPKTPGTTICYNKSMKKLMVLYKIAFAALALVAVFMQFKDVLEMPNPNIGNFFSYFTIESNIFAAAVLLVSATYVIGRKQTSQLSYLRGAATLYMAMTGIIYSLLLAGVDVQITTPWVNEILHYIFPLVMVADWIIDRPEPGVRLKKAVWWLAFPVLYLLYSLIRGQITGWYPYPFLNVKLHGLGDVLSSSVVIALGVVVLAWAVVKVAQLGPEKTPVKKSGSGKKKRR